MPGDLAYLDRPNGDSPLTTVEFTLAETAEGGTLLTCRESGFSALSAADRERAYPMNVEGWSDLLPTLRDFIES